MAVEVVARTPAAAITEEMSSGGEIGMQTKGRKEK